MALVATRVHDPRMKIKQGRPIQPRVTFNGGEMRRARIALDLSAAKLGARIGVSKDAIYGWETGRARPASKSVADLERVLKCKLRS